MDKQAKLKNIINFISRHANAKQTEQKARELEEQIGKMKDTERKRNIRSNLLLAGTGGATAGATGYHLATRKRES